MISVRRSILGALAIIACASLPACTQLVEGAAQKGPDELPPGAVDVLRLSPGNYPTSPQPPLGAAGSQQRGAYVEGARMAAAVVGPWEVDSAFTDAAQSHIYASTAALRVMLLSAAAEAMDKHQFVTGFTSGRKASQGYDNLVFGVLRFADEQAAAAAAAELHTLNLDPVDELLPPKEPIEIPGYPDTLASTGSLRSISGRDVVDHSVTAVTARGPFVLYQFAKKEEDPQGAVDLVTAGLGRQIAKIDEFSPTPVDELADLPIDPTGLLARTLPFGEINFNMVGAVGNSYDAAGALHFQMDPIAAEQVWDETGMDEWTLGGAAVYQTRDSDAAAELLAVEVDLLTELSDGAADPVPHLGENYCFVLKGTLSNTYSCYATADRYLIETSAAQLPDAHQQAAAQYLMLTSS